MHYHSFCEHNSMVNSLRVDDWSVELAIIASKVPLVPEQGL